MKRVMFVVAGALTIALVVWIARNAYWVDVKVPTPLKGEALTNPFYAAQRLATALGGRSAWDRAWSSPSTDAVVVLSSWHWDLSAGRRQAIERWVEAGGRLVVDETLSGSLETFEKWSGIVREFDFDEDEDEDDDDSDRDAETMPCDRFTEEGDGAAGQRWVCDTGFYSFLVTKNRLEWALRNNDRGAQAMRVRVGRGSVTVINAAPFRYRNVFDGDHGWLFVAATQFQRGDDVRFLSEDDYPSLLALLWQYAGPAVVLVLLIIALLLWRGWVRFGPMAPPLPSARRSLAEQIRGSGQFALRHGSGDSLHAAVVRALNEAVTRRVPGYTHLPPQEQTAALARLTGFERGSLAAALHHLAARRADRLRNALALLETARRRALTQHPRSSDGTADGTD
jgi:hypothetical protein